MARVLQAGKAAHCRKDHHGTTAAIHPAGEAFGQSGCQLALFRSRARWLQPLLRRNQRGMVKSLRAVNGVATKPGFTTLTPMPSA